MTIFTLRNATRIINLRIQAPNGAGYQGKAGESSPKHFINNLHFIYIHILHCITLYVIIILSKEENKMLIQIKEIKTKTYPLDQGFFIDITTTCKEYQAWLYHKNYGIKQHIYGMYKCDIEYEKFLELIENTIEENLDFYVDDYFDYTERKLYYARKNYITKTK